MVFIEIVKYSRFIEILINVPRGEEPVKYGSEDGQFGGTAGHPHLLHHRPHIYHRIHFRLFITSPVKST